MPIAPYHESLTADDDLADAANLSGQRVFNGHSANTNQFPYQVSIRTIATGGGAGICGGSIISATWVLTAAHCTINGAQFVMRFGTLNLQFGGVSHTSFRQINHPNYNPVNLNNDIAVVSIPSALTFSPAIRVVRLPTRAQSGATFANLQTTVSGWGAVSATGGAQTMLRWANKRVITNAQCAQRYGNSAVVAHVVCTLGYTGSQSVCGGDSGGPLVLNEGGEPTQIGVVAFSAHPDIGGCAAGHPSGFMRTASFLAWIQQHTGVAIRG